MGSSQNQICTRHLRADGRGREELKRDGCVARERRIFWVCLRDGYSVLQAHSTEGVASHFLKVKKKVQVHLAAHFLNG